MEELTAIVKDLPTHKSPCSDGLPYSYYKAYLNIVPYLLALYNSLL